jgi:hypothetical protein
VLIFDSGSVERRRLEGYYPNAEFRAQLELALARTAFMHKQWQDAEARYAAVLAAWPDTVAAPKAMP